MNTDARMLIAVRVVVVTTLLMASLIFQYTAAESGRELLPINYIYLITGASYALTLIYIVIAMYMPMFSLIGQIG